MAPQKLRKKKQKRYQTEKAGDGTTIKKTPKKTKKKMKKQKQKNLKRIMVRDGMCGASVEALKNRCSHFKLIPCWF